MQTLWQDLRYALRQLRKTPGLAVAAIAVLALGIGANTAIFSVVNAALLRPLPFGAPRQLVRLWHTPPAKSFPGRKIFAIAPANFLDWKQQGQAFENMAIYSFTEFTLTGHDEPESLNAARVSADFFSTLHVPPLIGRVFRADEDQLGHDREVILSYPYWKSRFGGDSNIAGKTVTLNDQTYTIVGVMPRSFRLPEWAKMWTPMAFTPKERVVRGEHHYMAVARLKQSVTIQQAQGELDAISKRLEEQYPEDDRGWGALALPLQEDVVSEVKPTLLVLFGAVGLVLLIACANVANLFLAKVLSRRKEIAVRAALGASHARLVQQTLCETVLLSLIGAALGAGLATYGIDLITKFLGSSLPASVQVGLDWEVLVFTLLIAVLTGLLAGLLPGWRLANTNVQEALKQAAGRGASDASGSRTRNGLVAAEVGLSLMLLVGAGLMMRTLWALHKVDAGFDEKNVLTLRLAVEPAKYASAATEISATNDLLAHVRGLPGVTAAGAVDDLPLDGGGSTQPIAIAGRPTQALADQPEVAVRVITPGYFPTMRISLQRGREFTDADTSTSEPVAMISASMAKRFWPDQNPLGQHLTLSFYPGISREIVGVVADVKLDALNETETAALYYPASQLTAPASADWQSFGFAFVVRTSPNAASMGQTIVNSIHQVDPAVPVNEVQTMEAIVNDSLTQQRFTMLLLAAFGGLAVLLAGVGIYGVLAYSVRQRFREIGIRFTLGAQMPDVLRMVIIDGIKPALIGVLLGAVGAVALGRVLANFVYGVSTRDVPTLLVVSMLLLLVASVASVVPAYRATRVDPIQILRDE
jgi:putative ABC transport system permease protein